MEGIKEPRFAANNSMPGEDWYSRFLARHNVRLKLCLTLNLKSSRAEVATKTIKTTSRTEEKTVQGIAPHWIINFDETNFVDDAGKKKIEHKKKKSTQKISAITPKAAPQLCLLQRIVIFFLHIRCIKQTIYGINRQ